MLQIAHIVVVPNTDKKIISSNEWYKRSKLSTGCESSGWFHEIILSTNEEKMGDFVAYKDVAIDFYIVGVGNKINTGDLYYDYGDNTIKRATLGFKIENDTFVRKVVASSKQGLVHESYTEDGMKVAEEIIPHSTVDNMAKLVRNYKRVQGFPQVKVIKECTHGNRTPCGTDCEVRIKSDQSTFTKHEVEELLKKCKQDTDIHSGSEFAKKYGKTMGYWELFNKWKEVNV